jgi:N-acetyl-anhydromuramyl-L-alanine amidase AmpD
LGWTDLVKEDWIKTKPDPKIRWPYSVRTLVIHSTKGKDSQTYLQEIWSGGWGVHYLITEDGRVYGEPKPSNWEYKAVPPLDSRAIHIVWEGLPRANVTNPKQWSAGMNLIRALVQTYEIHLSNRDVESREGIFTHVQSKKRFGRFTDLQEYGEEGLVREILHSLGGEYFPETEWKDRFDPKWVLRKEDPKRIQKHFLPNRGRGLTPAPRVGLKSLISDENGKAPEERRVRYQFRGKIRPTCVVLHYTAISTYKRTIEVLEARGLNATILVDSDGKAYQLLDSLFDYPSTAYGTNEKCIQIEIVGKDTEALLGQEEQLRKVVEIVQELSVLFSFPITNQKIEAFRGVYSHTQAKKKFGGSIFLSAPDFDPGEPYMKKVIEAAGGVYYPEPEWFDRQSDDWVILDRAFQP